MGWENVDWTRGRGGGVRTGSFVLCERRKLADWLIYCDGRYNIEVGLLSVRHGASQFHQEGCKIRNHSAAYTVLRLRPKSE